MDVLAVTAPPRTPTYRKNVATWRAHNQRRWEFERDVLPAEARAAFVCECTSGACLQPVELTLFDFEAAHLLATWTAVLPDHVMPDDAAVIVLRYPTHWIVELG
jgi:hypothetical protein